VALALVRDENLAADLEQDLWVKVIEKPPVVRGSIRGWLAATLRNTAVDGFRAESSRRLREQAVARPEWLPQTDDVVAEAEGLKRIVNAVMDLEEPYRSAVLLRYFRDLPARDIAARQGVPIETVRTRLKRAISTLRERFDAERGGDRKAWCLALVPLIGRPEAVAPAAAGMGAPIATTTGLTLGGTFMASKTVVVAATVLVSFAAGVVLSRSLGPGPEGHIGSGSGGLPYQPSPGQVSRSSPLVLDAGDAGPDALPEAPPPVAPAAPVNDKDVRTEVLKMLDSLDGNWRKTYAVGKDLARLDPGIVLGLLRERWKQIRDPSDRQQILKAFQERPPHPCVLDVLDLGMTDDEPTVQNWAMTYLRKFAGQDFSEDWKNYAVWRKETSGKDPGTVLLAAVHGLAARIRAAGVEEMEGLLSLLREASRGTSPGILNQSGMADAIEPWISRLATKELYVAFEILRYAHVGEDYLRRAVVPLLLANDFEKRAAAFWALGEKRNAWAFDVLLPFLRETDVRVAESAARALGEIGDPRAIPPLLDVLRDDPSPEGVARVGSTLSRLTGVPWDATHDAAWWESWWTKNRDRFQR
jgi:RNA polymerase sigma-70 factor (ECF subfamily)